MSVLQALGNFSTSFTRSGVNAFSQFLEQLFVKSFQILRRTAANETVVHNDFLVDPVYTGVNEVRPDCRVRRHGASAQHAGLDQGLRAMTDHRNRF